MGSLQIGVPLDPAELADRHAITELLHYHSRALDRCDAELMKAVYWSDAEVDYGGFKGKAHDFAPLVMQSLGAQYQLTQHRITNTVMARVNTDQIHTESYCFAKHLAADGTEEMLYTGRYLDQFSKREGAWKFQHRCVVMDWSRRLSVTDERDQGSFAALTKGNNTERDPSFDHLGDLG